MIAFAFWMFAAVTVASGLLVISSRNPVHSVLWLILAFFSSAALFVLLGAEFLAMLLVIVYVGAVAVLFLFVVMMLDINFVKLREGALQYIPFGILIGVVLAAELVTLGLSWQLGDLAASNAAFRAPTAPDIENTRALGDVIYTDYWFIFQTCGMILLVAMIGAIVLTLRSRPNVRKQDIGAQTRRRPTEAYALVDVASGEGVTPGTLPADRKG